MPKKPAHDHVAIEVDCLACGKEFDYQLALPTAVTCSHCGAIVDARLGVVKKKDR